MMIHVFQKLLFLLRIFSIFILISAASCKSAEPVTVPEPLPDAEKTKEEEVVKVISYTVDPAGPWRDNSGYIGLEYETRDQIWEKKKALLDRKASSADEYEKTLRRLPAYGLLIINIGRQDLMHANTRWYTYAAYATAPAGSKTIFSIKGEEGIPNVKGRDGNWWNVVEIPLREEILSRIEVTVTDNKTGRDFKFTVSRVESVP